MSAYRNFGQAVTRTPQVRPIPGREAEMVPNNAGGYGFVLNDWERLKRFLILGSDKGTYYVDEKNLTHQNVDAIIRCIQMDGPHVVSLACDVNVNNRAPKVDPQLFALALAMQHGDNATKRAALEALALMLRTGTHLLHFAAMLNGLGGWNRSKRSVIANWFERDADTLAYQMLKYQSRDGWSMRDLLRVAHPNACSPEHNLVFAWAAGKLDASELPRHTPVILRTYAAMLRMEGSPAERALWGVKHGLPREVLPTEAMQDPAVQIAQLLSMPIHALIRNLGNLSASGALRGAEEKKLVVDTLTNKNSLRRSRVHPFAILLAMLVYKGGRGFRSAKIWNPSKRIIEALDDAYDLAFDNVTPTGRRMLIGIDVSASMAASCVGTPVPASTAAAAMAITLARCEPEARTVLFNTEVTGEALITKRTSISGLDQYGTGGTDLTAPIRWALKGKAPFDAIILLTDNETWGGRSHPTERLDEYRREVSPDTKLICCAMAANHANVVDPKDPLQFGCAGLDANLPSLITEFINRPIARRS